MLLVLFFPMFPFDSPEDLWFSDTFSGGSKTSFCRGGNYVFKVDNRNIRSGGKYVQS